MSVRVQDDSTQVERSRSRFRSLLVANPNYFGTAPGSGLKAVEPKTGDTTYEALGCVSYSPGRDRVEATVVVKLPFGYGGGPCSPGTREHVRFYLDYGTGWEDAGLAAASVHDYPVDKDCAGEETHPLTYAVGVDHTPRRDWCGRPVLPRLRAILSWEVVPPAGQPGWRPVWGDVRDCHGMVRARRFRWLDVADLLPAKLLAVLPPAALEAVTPPVPDPGPLAPDLAGLVKIARAGDVPEHRFAAPILAQAQLATALDLDDLAPVAVQAAELGLDLAAVAEQLEDGKGDTTYEELGCLGLDNGADSLTATIRIKRPSGYGGPACRAGSTEYVAFWADWDDDCGYTYLGTVAVRVHDYDPLPRGGLCLAAILPVDLGEVRRRCDRPVLRRVRAVLSWASPPSTVDPDAVPYWGNRVDSHVQVAARRPYDGRARFTIVGGVQSTAVDPGTGLTTAPAELVFTSTPVGAGRPFAGQVVLHGPTDPALSGTVYRIRAHDLDGGGSTVLTTPFTAVAFPGVAVTVTPDPVNGWVPWPQWATNTTGILGRHIPGGQNRWRYDLELQAPAGVADQATVQMDNLVRNTVEPTDTVNAGDLELDTAAACRHPRSTPLQGRFVARDRHFSHWGISVLGGPGPNPPVVTVSAPIATSTQTALAGQGFEVDVSQLQPCGYVVRLTITDRAIVNSVALGHHTTIDRGVCLE